MSNFETPPSATPESGQESPSKVMERLSGRMSAWRSEYLQALAFTAAAWAAAVPAAERILETERAEPTLDIDVHYDELRALDPEATPERIDAILATFPKGFIEGEVGSIGFKDKKKTPLTKYGKALQTNSEALAHAAGGKMRMKADIVFWAGSKNFDSGYIWGRTLLHEVAHAVDWRNSHKLEFMERDSLKRAVYERVGATDRFRSTYVETISNDDAQTERDVKAREYWAEIVAAYLSGDLADPQDPDFKLVQGFITEEDPTFDRDQALVRRQLVLREISEAKTAREYAMLPQAERDANTAWLEERAKLETEPSDPERQRKGRQELVAAIRRMTDSEKYVSAVLNLGMYREELFEERSYKDRISLENRLRSLTVSNGILMLDEAEDPKALEVRLEIERIMTRSGIWVGGDKGAMRLLPGEFDALGLAEGILQSQLGWQRPQAEADAAAAAEYQARGSFTPGP